MTRPNVVSKHFQASLLPLFFALTFFIQPAFGHHPFLMDESYQASVWQSFFSGIAHPLLGPDHLLFILGIALVGLTKGQKSILPLLAVGLGGSLLVQLQPLPDFLTAWAEALVSLSLAIEGLIVLNLLSTKWLLPMFALHGYLLGSTIVGAEPSPLIGYFCGLLFVQGSLLLGVTSVSKKVAHRLLRAKDRITLAGIWIGIGLAFSWVALIE